MNFIDLMNIRYKNELIKYNVSTFKFWDDYALFIYEKVSKYNEEYYYKLLEYDLQYYSNQQTRSEREASSKAWQRKQ